MKQPSEMIRAMQSYVNGHVNKTVGSQNFRCHKQQLAIGNLLMTL